jgi:hypothetical protein
LKCRRHTAKNHFPANDIVSFSIMIAAKIRKTHNKQKVSDTHINRAAIVLE